MSEKKESILSVVHPDELIGEEQNTVHGYIKIHDEDDAKVHVDTKDDAKVHVENKDDAKVHVDTKDDAKVHVENKDDAKGNTKDPDPDILSENKVNVEIVPDVKSNQVMVQLCSMSLFCCLWTTGK
jgi:hypothetical protein